jgi:hypothetical protein
MYRSDTGKTFAAPAQSGSDRNLIAIRSGLDWDFTGPGPELAAGNARLLRVQDCFIGIMPESDVDQASAGAGCKDVYSFQNKSRMKNISIRPALFSGTRRYTSDPALLYALR